MNIPDSSCPWGYNHEDLVNILGDRMEEFWGWMTGQTVMLCDGKEYNHETKEYRPTPCADAPHGLVVYHTDLARFLRGLPVID
jgi:hypothetical protein